MCDTAVCVCNECGHETCGGCPKINSSIEKYKVSGIFTLETEAESPKEAREKALAILKADGIQCNIIEVEEEAVEL